MPPREFDSVRTGDSFRGTTAREATSRQEAESEEGEGGADKPANPRDLLSQMVRSDPDTAAGILRGWIDNAN